MSLKSLTVALSFLLILGCKKENLPPSGTTWTPPPPDPIDSIGRDCPTWICLPSWPYSSSITQFPANGAYLAEGAAVAAGDKVFFGGGHEEGFYFGPVADVYKFDASTGGWSKGPGLSVPRSHLAAAYTGNTVLFAGGKMETVYNQHNPDYYSTVDLFDVTTLQRSTVDLSEPRAHLAAVSDGNRAFFIGGVTTGNQASAVMDVYNGSLDQWSAISLPRERAFAGAVISEGKLYIAGGQNPAKPGEAITAMDIYEISSGSWSSLEIPHPHPKASVVLLNEKIFVAGGDGLLNNTVDILDLKSNAWSTHQLSDSRNNIAVVAANNKIIFLGGNYSPRIDWYDDNTGIWDSGTLNTGVEGVMAATVTSQNRGVFAGFLFLNGNAVTNTVWSVYL